MNTGAERNRINALILNSPFLDFYQSGFESSSAIGVRIISTIAPYAKN
jgi:hypothetical protein